MKQNNNMSKRTQGYRLPTTSSFTRSSITDEKIRQKKYNSSKGRSCDRSPRKLTYEEIRRGDQNNRKHQHTKTTFELSSGDWNSSFSDQIDREYLSASRSSKFPDENLEYTLTDQYDRRHHLTNSTLELPGDNWNSYLSDQIIREYRCTSSSPELSDDNFDIQKPPCPLMPRTDKDFSGAFSSLTLSPTRKNKLSYTPQNLKSPLGVKDIRPSQTAQIIESADLVQLNENDEVLTFTGQNQDALKNNVESEIGHGSIFPEKKVPVSGSSNDEDHSYRNTPGISATLLRDDNNRSPSQTKTDFRRSLSHDTKQNKQQNAPTHLQSKEKPQKPERAIINTSNDSKLQDDDDSAIPLLTHKRAVAVDYKKKSAYLELCDNLLFYQGKIKSKPAPGYTIETILERFCDDDFIEKKYPYCIKWLFPIPNKSLDRNTQELLPHEIKAIQNDKETASRVFKAFVLVLDYYGIIMVNTETGELMKSRNWKNRWTIINTNNEQEFKHITRVLVSLGALGYERYQVPLIEIFIKNKDDITEFDWNSVRHWIDNVNDEEQQNALFEKYGEQIFSLETLEAYDTQTKHEQQQSGFDNTLEHLGTIGS